MKRNIESAVTVKFTVPAFRYKGVEYKSAEVEKAAEAGDETAQAIVANLVKMGSGIVQLVDGDEEPEALPPAKAKAPKVSKATKPTKARGKKKTDASNTDAVTTEGKEE